MTVLLLIASILCGLISAAASFGWFDVSANASGFLALSVVLLTASMLPVPRYFR